jgi:hypothetical protein
MEMRRVVWNVMMFAVALTLSVGAQPAAFAQDPAPDPTGQGPFDVTSAEYKFPATLDPDVSGMATELWARVFWPADLSSGPFPLIVFLHGNHATCGHGTNPRIDDNTQYTFYGTCPPGYVVTPNHEGYDYIAPLLASWGYVIVSINANRGVTAAPGTSDDLGVNLVRGRLILKHLQRVSEWNTYGGTPDSLGVELQGKIDFSQVGLFGHSRGGEGVRAAYHQYFDEGSPWPSQIPDHVNFVALFEIGPVDGQTSRQLNADGAVWNVLLPMCDGDVSNLQGVKAFDRLFGINESPTGQKSSFTVWGANHNSYNTEWQVTDSAGCSGPGNTALFPLPQNPPISDDSPAQRKTALAAVMAFFRGNLGPNANPAFNQNFNPQFAPTTVVTDVTRVDRGYTDSPNSNITTIFEEFDKPTGINHYGFPNDSSNITIKHSVCSDPTKSCDDSVFNHNSGDTYGRFGQQQAAAISWTTSGSDTFFQTNWTAAGTGVDIGGYQTLDLRLSRQCEPPVPPATTACAMPNSLNPAGPTDFSIRLAMADGSLSDPVQLSTYSDLRGPVGGLNIGANPLHPILQTARIPLRDFTSADLTNLRGVRLAFDGTPTGAIYVANVRLSLLTGLALGGATVTAHNGANLSAEPTPSGVNTLITQGNTLTIRAVQASTALPNNQPGFEVVVTSDVAFPVRDELAALRIADQVFTLSRYQDSGDNPGDTHTLIFTLSIDQFAQINSGDPVIVQYGADESTQWVFGPLNKVVQ